MEWRDLGIVVGLRKHGETSVIAEVMTRDHGRHLGLVRSGRTRRMQPVLQPGTEVEAVWRARLEDGRFVPEEVQPEGGRRMAYDAFLRGLR